MLIACEQCGQIVEVVNLNEHLLEECERALPFRYEPPLGTQGYDGCPLCALPLPEADDAAKQHLCYECTGNPRIQVPAAA